MAQPKMKKIALKADPSKIREVPIRVPDKFIAFITDEDTAIGFLIAGMGNRDFKKNQTNFLIVTDDTPLSTIETKFKEFSKRPDIGIVLISQYIAEKIRKVVDSHMAAIPAILEIPSRDHPYDPDKDSIINWARRLHTPKKH